MILVRWFHRCAKVQNGRYRVVSNCFLPAVGKDPRTLCSDCRGRECSMEDLCGDCYDWTDKMQTKVSMYRTKLAAQGEKERKDKAPGLFLVSLQVCLFS